MSLGTYTGQDTCTAVFNMHLPLLARYYSSMHAGGFWQASLCRCQGVPSCRECYGRVWHEELLVLLVMLWSPLPDAQQMWCCQRLPMRQHALADALHGMDGTQDT